MRGGEFVLGRELDGGAVAVVSTSPGERGAGQPLEAGEEVQLFPLFQEKVVLPDVTSMVEKRIPCQTPRGEFAYYAL